MLALTWDQLEVVTAAVGEYRALQMNTIMEAVAGALGGTVEKPARVRRKGKKPPARPSKGDSKPSAASQFAALGMDVSVE